MSAEVEVEPESEPLDLDAVEAEAAAEARLVAEARYRVLTGEPVPEAEPEPDGSLPPVPPPPSEIRVHGVPVSADKIWEAVLKAAAATHAAELLDEAGAGDERALRNARARQHATDQLAAEAFEVFRAARRKRSARQFAAEPRLAAVMSDVLAAEVNLLGGPTAAGKSLLARDWALALAAGQPWLGHVVPDARNVLWIASEGTHDFAERWSTQPLWEEAADRVYLLDAPVSLLSAADVTWLLDEYAEEPPGLVIFDVIYGMGMADDNGTRDALPVLAALKRVSAGFGGGTLALGHSGHNGERRFRGSSAWRQLAAVEWHAADGTLSCEKSKLADTGPLGAYYQVAFPRLEWISASDSTAQKMIEMHTEVDRIVGLIDSLGLPQKTGRPVCASSLRDAGHKVADHMVELAVKQRKERP